jgi:polyisoprenoid-binding protein YceI
MKKLTSILLVLCIYTIINATDDPKVKIMADKKESVIEYSMTHPLHSWTAENKDVTSIILTDKDKSKIYKVAVSVKVSSFDSKNANRDSHMIEATEALKYPIISFTSNSIQADGNALKIKGQLTFHGVTQEISFDGKKEMINNKLQVTGSFTVKLTDYKISPPSLMGSSVEDAFKINFKVLY